MSPVLWLLMGVLVLVMLGRIGPWRLAIWQIMAGGALVALLSGQITVAQAWRAIDGEVMVFLFAMFVLGRAAIDSGLLDVAGRRVFRHAHTPRSLLLLLVMGAGLGSALLMNDTLAIIGTPLALRLARDYRLGPEPLLLALAFAVTLGSVMSPIGNPQNLLIALHGGLPRPFGQFLGALGVPTLINLLVLWAWLSWLYALPASHTAVPETSLPNESIHREPVPAVRDRSLARLTGWGLGLVGVLVLWRLLALLIWPAVPDAPPDAVAAPSLSALMTAPWAGSALWSWCGYWLRHLPLGGIALAGALPVLLFSPRRVRLVRELDWATLMFFIGLFVLMGAVGHAAGLVQVLRTFTAGGEAGSPIVHPLAVFAVGLLGSQLISNVPLVALYLPVLHTLAAPGAIAPLTLFALAVGATLAGNLLILGAASNVIIAQAAQRAGTRIDAWRFLRAGLPLTLVQALIYALWLGWFGA